MKKVISIGKQDFAYIRENDCFYVDKTSLIKEWWEGKDDVTAQNALKDLTKYLAKYYGKNVIILLDEYDTPMQEAYVHGYWDIYNPWSITNFLQERQIWEKKYDTELIEQRVKRENIRHC